MSLRPPFASGSDQAATVPGRLHNDTITALGGRPPISCVGVNKPVGHYSYSSITAVMSAEPQPSRPTWR
jgi:hypothetical protein